MKVDRARLLEQVSVLGKAVRLARSEQQLRRYVEERGRYRRQLASRGIRHDERRIIDAVRARLRSRGHVLAPVGEIHTFAMLSAAGWTQQLLDELAELGPVTHFDLDRWPGVDRESTARRGDAMREGFRAAAARRPVDWIFSYAAPEPVHTELLPWVHNRYGCLSVNLAMDDKHAWHDGTDALYRAFDLCWTTARESAVRYTAVGARGVFLHPGFRPSSRPEPLPEPDIAISFVGAAYGVRRPLLMSLREAGLPVVLFGQGWGEVGRGMARDPVEIFRRSQITLGIGAVMHADAITTVKGRDFEVVGAGGGMYLTTFNADLTDAFVIGREIACYRNAIDLPEVLEHYLDRPQECRAIAEAGYARALGEHRWRDKFAALLSWFR